MTCAESDDSHGSAQKRRPGSISRLERTPMRFAMDQHPVRVVAHNALQKAVKQIRYEDAFPIAYYHCRRIPGQVSVRPRWLVPTEWPTALCANGQSQMAPTWALEVPSRTAMMSAAHESRSGKINLRKGALARASRVPW
jgi:hypothetical protein